MPTGESISFHGNLMSFLWRVKIITESVVNNYTIEKSSSLSLEFLDPSSNCFTQKHIASLKEEMYFPKYQPNHNPQFISLQSLQQEISEWILASGLNQAFNFN